MNHPTTPPFVLVSPAVSGHFNVAVTVTPAGTEEDPLVRVNLWANPQFSSELTALIRLGHSIAPDVAALGAAGAILHMRTNQSTFASLHTDPALGVSSACLLEIHDPELRRQATLHLDRVSRLLHSGHVLTLDRTHFGVVAYAWARDINVTESSSNLRRLGDALDRLVINHHRYVDFDAIYRPTSDSNS